MTAEIAILNRNAVALAADSAVTLRNPAGQKIYNTANKLFMLSKYRPVGIMIFGNADLMAVPWETIVKMYRAELGPQRFDSLEDYAKHFLDFFHRENLLFPTELQEQFLQQYLGYRLTQLRKELLAEMEREIKSRGPLSEGEVSNIANEVLKKYNNDFAKTETLPSFGEAEIKELLTKYRPAIVTITANIFEKLPIDFELVLVFCGHALSKRNFFTGQSGVVVAGFGEKDVFPSLFAYECDAVFGNRMRYFQINKTIIGVTPSAETNASINPFAQREMVNRFMEGIDPVYQERMKAYLVKLLAERYPEAILDAISAKLNATEQGQFREALIKLGGQLAEAFDEESRNFRQENYIGPIINTVASLPKDELAAMAESLINLTSFKRRVTSAEEDTVGGPIDVAVISKGDGFVWIKRKHYFDKDLNPNFFANYYRKDEVR